MTTFDECIWCIEHGSWHTASKLYIELSLTNQILLVCHIAGLENGKWYCENLAAAVAKLNDK